jgi:hypothetical protein
VACAVQALRISAGMRLRHWEGRIRWFLMCHRLGQAIEASRIMGRSLALLFVAWAQIASCSSQQSDWINVTVYRTTPINYTGTQLYGQYIFA